MHVVNLLVRLLPLLDYKFAFTATHASDGDETGAGNTTTT